MSNDVVTIKGGPIAHRGYDHLKLVVDHQVVLPDGRTQILPAGTILIMLEAGGGYDQMGGDAFRAPEFGGPIKS